MLTHCTAKCVLISFHLRENNNNPALHAVLFHCRLSVEKELEKSGTLQTITICILTLVLFIAPFIIFLVRNATQTIQVSYVASLDLFYVCPLIFI